MFAAMTNPTFRVERESALRRLLKERILLLDGGQGTAIQSYRLSEEDFRGERFADHAFSLKGNNDLLVLTKPAVIAEIHQSFFDAGSDIIETNTFNATSISQADYGLEALAYELNYEAAKLARKVADDFMAKHPDREVFVAGGIGPTNRTASMSPDVNRPGFRAVSFDELRLAYRDPGGRTPRWWGRHLVGGNDLRHAQCESGDFRARRSIRGKGLIACRCRFRSRSRMRRVAPFRGKPSRLSGPPWPIPNRSRSGSIAPLEQRT